LLYLTIKQAFENYKGEIAQLLPRWLRPCFPCTCDCTSPVRKRDCQLAVY